MALVIKAIDESGPMGLPALSIAHHGEQNGDLLRDAEMCFGVRTADASVIFSVALALSLTVCATACSGTGSNSSNSGGSTLTPVPTPTPSSVNQWTWMSGSSVSNEEGVEIGVYPPLGQAPADRVPGGRGSSASWTDSTGKLWLFGGFTGQPTAVNELWQFNPNNKEWTWESGGNVGDEPGVYGSLGVASTSNLPGARYDSATWTDGNGKFWLFGGTGYDSVGTFDNLNDLWDLTPRREPGHGWQEAAWSMPHPQPEVLRLQTRLVDDPARHFGRIAAATSGSLEAIRVAIE